MRRTEKETILDLLGNMRTLHTMLTDSSDDLLPDYLSTCQQAAISIGELLENNMHEGLQEIIGILEQYAEYCYLLTCQGRCRAEDVRQLDDMSAAVVERVKKVQIMKKIAIGFADYWPGWIPEDNWLVDILKKHFEVEVIDTRNPYMKNEVEYLFFSVYSQNYLDFDCIRIFYTGENIIPDFNLCDYAIGFGFEKLTIGDRYFADPLWYSFIRNYKRRSVLEKYKNIKRKDIANKKFCAMVVSNGTDADSFRTDFFNRLSQYKAVDSGGGILNNVGGKVKDKLAFFSDYKFSFAMENVSHEGYCTEKIIDSFIAGTVPIYWGDTEITEYFNERAFINCHAYSTVDEVINKIIEIDNNDEEYLAMLEEPIFSNDFYSPEQQDIRLENWLISIFEREYAFRRNRIGTMKNYEDGYRRQRDVAAAHRVK